MRQITLPPEALPLGHPLRSVRILHEDSRLLALEKPSGFPSQPLPREPDALSMVRFAVQHAPEVAFAGPREEEGGLLHRLDQGTSGILLFAKTREAYDGLKALWKTNAVEKTYRALVAPPPSLPRLPHLISVPIGHSAKSAKRMIAIQEEKDLRKIRGKPQPARTWVERITPHDPGSQLQAPELADLQVRIETGVMHQIRVHLKMLGSPILGDDRYGGILAERLMLHAWKLRLNAPGIDVEIAAPVPWSP